VFLELIKLQYRHIAGGLHSLLEHGGQGHPHFELCPEAHPRASFSGIAADIPQRIAPLDLNILVQVAVAFMPVRVSIIRCTASGRDTDWLN
jgi:hypothetical protein